MSRYRGPRLKIVRRLGPLPGLINKRRKLTDQNKPQDKKSKKSQYRIRLEEKQKLRFHYGLTERQLLRYIRIARKAKGSTGQTLLQLLEMRLDNTVFRLGMAPTIRAARQLVNHGHIVLNERVVDIPSYRCKPNDKISIRDRERSRTLIENNRAARSRLRIPGHLAIKQNAALITQIVDPESIGIKVNELFIVEYYSRQA
uniref:Small ribosomal subunit protein uS4c n=1 Tax=Zygnema circumcarinatum TaxID=35869 RepID=A0A6N0GXG4_ZYGCR|nr:ribosomal protein S4 [Zygnema circumcarinatum]